MTIQGETSLTTLLSTLSPSLHPSHFVFLTCAHSTPPPATLYRQMSFQENEGLTVITTLESAQSHSITEYTFPSRMITCNVHSSLEAVGFLAKLSAVLAGKDIGCNPVSGFYHDHLFVPVGKVEAAMAALGGLAEEVRRKEG